MPSEPLEQKTMTQTFEECWNENLLKSTLTAYGRELIHWFKMFAEAYWQACLAHSPEVAALKSAIKYLEQENGIFGVSPMKTAQLTMSRIEDQQATIKELERLNTPKLIEPLRGIARNPDGTPYLGACNGIPTQEDRK